jgi:hypothetical protein
VTRDPATQEGRNPAGYDAIIYVDNVVRGHSFDEVDPSRGP